MFDDIKINCSISINLLLFCSAIKWELLALYTSIYKYMNIHKYLYIYIKAIMYIGREQNRSGRMEIITMRN